MAEIPLNQFRLELTTNLVKVDAEYLLLNWLRTLPLDFEISTYTRQQGVTVIPDKPPTRQGDRNER